MKRSLTPISAILALSLIGAPLALAEPGQHDNQHGNAPEAHGPGNAAPHGAPGSQHGQNPPMQPMHMTQTQGMQPPRGSMPEPRHGDAMRVPVSHQAMPMAHAENHGAPQRHEVVQGGGHQWRSGDHYSGDRHYVSNWNQYHLRQPPQGYQWVQDGGEFVLVAVASGIIADVILNSTYQ